MKAAQILPSSPKSVKNKSPITLVRAQVNISTGTHNSNARSFNCRSLIRLVRRVFLLLFLNVSFQRPGRFSKTHQDEDCNKS